MKRVLAAILLLFVAFVVVADEPNLDETVALVLREADATAVFESFGRMFSVEVEVDPEINGLLTIQLENVRARTALQAVCESLGCEWRIEDGTLYLTAVERPREASSPPAFKPIDIELKEADATDFFASLVQILEADLILDPKVSGTFSIQLEQAGLDEVLSQVCAALDCVAKLVVNNDGRVLEVRPKVDG